MLLFGCTMFDEHFCRRRSNDVFVIVEDTASLGTAYRAAGAAKTVRTADRKR